MRNADPAYCTRHKPDSDLCTQLMQLFLWSRSAGVRRAEEVHREEVQPSVPVVVEAFHDEPAAEPMEAESTDKIKVNGVDSTPTTCLRDLRDGAPSEERAAKVLPEVKVPSSDEVAQHEVTHMPFRNWCKQCQMHLGREDKH